MFNMSWSVLCDKLSSPSGPGFCSRRHSQWCWFPPPHEASVLSCRSWKRLVAFSHTADCSQAGWCAFSSCGRTNWICRYEQKWEVQHRAYWQKHLAQHLQLGNACHKSKCTELDYGFHKAGVIMDKLYSSHFVRSNSIGGETSGQE